ncbi:MAG: hypothetical protein LUH02_04240 [Erysipelotrichaceae bacterium]|nr:hypothetical protein [Erysipelotrichaceae bacterium]
MIIDIIKAWLKWHKNWDALCNCCGKCCYSRSLGENGEVIIHYNSPCDYLDTETNRCRVYEQRFQKCRYCKKVNLFRVLFNPTLPKDCTYLQTFRLWEVRKKEK